MGKFIVKYLESEVLTPCTPLIKCEGIPLISDVIGASTSIYNTSETNKANVDSVAKTNETNYQIAKETNDMSQKQFQTNLNWLQRQYYENQKREDTRYQRMVQDIQASGLNPALQNGQPSSVSSVGAPSPSSFHAAQMEAAHYDPLNLDFDPLSEHAANAINSYYQNKKVQAETENIGADTQTKAIENWTKLQRDSATFFETLAKIDNLISSTDVNKEQKEYLKQQRDNLKQNWELINRQFEDLANQPKYQNSLVQAQEKNVQSQTTLNDIESNYKAALLQANIRLSNAQSKSLIENLKLIAPQIGLLKSEHKLNNSKYVAQVLMNGFEALDFKDKAQLADIYGKNGFTQKGKNFFYALGDLLMHGLSNVKIPK